ncbi:MAG: 2-dehydropantoate 2-reductase [Lentisphaerae bacterium]|jgi:5'(3')-deoxyribonucleotidase|nr:2-dehydropantoate 2-reductase [Lentisphaerota bacterium]
MRIYVDFDDVICETAKHLASWANEQYGTNIEYEEIRWFDLRRSFKLEESRYLEVMEYAHHDAILSLYPPTPGAVDTMSQWQQRGLHATVVTGRPATTREASRKWLAQYGLEQTPLICVDKYRREPPPPPGVEPALTPEEFAALRFDVAIEDAPAALDLLANSSCGKIIIFDRPWNRDYVAPDSRFTRAANWHDIASKL